MKSFPVFLSLLFLLVFSSCAHKYYAPAEGNLMALSEKGDVKINGGLNLGGGYDQDRSRDYYSLQAGFSPVKHLGIQGSFFHLEDRGLNSDNQPAWGNGHTGELALGGYFSLSPDKPGRKIEWISDFYFGRGWGQVHNYYPTAGESHLDFDTYYFQPAIHLKVKKGFVGSLSVKFLNLNYREARLYGKIPESELEAVNSLRVLDPINMFESSFRLQWGFRYGKILFSISTTNTSESSDFEYINSVSYFGIILEPDEFFRKK